MSSSNCKCYEPQTRVQVVSKEQREERAAEMAAEMGEKPAEEMRPQFRVYRIIDFFLRELIGFRGVCVGSYLR